MSAERPVFLTAHWRHLVMLNYVVDPVVLRPHVPRGTTLDEWSGRHYLSVVAFRFLGTRIKGVPIPCHRDFDEINLRFYVGRQGAEGWRRGVVFIKEVVPRWAVAAVARWVYHENYVACPTRSSVDLPNGVDGTLHFSWRPRRIGELAVSAAITGRPRSWDAGSEAEFITQHYWGYATQRDRGTKEYRVEHPPWKIWVAHGAELTGPVAEFYGPAFGEFLSRPPVSAFVATGSPVTVRQGQRL